MTEANRQEIKDKVAAGEARHRARDDSTLFDRAGEAAIEAKDRFTAFAREHPITTVAGGLALGILISGLFPRSPTRRLGRQAGSLAASGAEAAMAYLYQALEMAGDAAGDAGRAASEAGREAGKAASHAGRDARRAASEAARAGAHRLGGLGETIGETVRALKHDAASAAEGASESARIARRNAEEGLRRTIRRHT